MIEIKIFVVGQLEENCYLLKDQETSRLAVVDPGDYSEALLETIDNNGEKLDFVFLTHGHFDHIGFVAELSRRYKPTVCACEYEREILTHGLYNRSSVRNIRLNSFVIDRFLKDNDTINFGHSTVKFIHTPGHTKGSGCYIIDDNIFTGDTVFCESVGRTDLPTGCQSDMIKSIKRISSLTGEFNIYPGHYYISTLSHEKKYNPFFK